MIINNPKTVNSTKLQNELTLAGIPNHGMTPTPKTLTIALVYDSDEPVALYFYNAHDPNPTIAELREIAIDEIDTQAEAARMQYLTKGDAQGQVYADKQAELEKYATDPQGAFPYAEQRAARHGITVADIMLEWLQIATQVKYMLLVSEGIRETAKDAVSIAENQEQVDTIISGLNWSE